MGSQKDGHDLETEQQIISYIEQLFVRLLTICVSSMEKCLFGSSTHFLLGFLFVLPLSCISSLDILEIRPLLVTLLANIFPHSVGCISIFFLVSFPVKKLLRFIQFSSVESLVVSDSLQPHEL